MAFYEFVMQKLGENTKQVDENDPILRQAFEKH